MEAELQTELLAALHKLAAGNLTLRDQETLAVLLGKASDEQFRQVVQELGPAQIRGCLDWCRRGLGARVPLAFSWHSSLARRLESAGAWKPELASQAAVVLLAIRTDLTSRCEQLMNELQSQPVSEDRLRHATNELKRVLDEERLRLSGLTREVQELESLRAELQQATLKAQQQADQREQARLAVQELQKRADELREMCGGSEADPWFELFTEEWKVLRSLLSGETTVNVEDLEKQFAQYPERRNTVIGLLQQLRVAFTELLNTREVLNRAQETASNEHMGQK